MKLKNILGAIVFATAVLLVGTGAVHAQLSTTTSTTTPIRPGSPATGAGGDMAANAVTLTITALAIAGGSFYISRALAKK